MRSLLDRVIWAVYFFCLSTLNISCHSLLACRVSTERSAVNHMGFPLYVTCCFSFAAFNILSLCLISVNLISMCLDVFLLGFILYETLHFLELIVSFSMLGKFSTIISSKILSLTYFFSSSSETPITWMLACLILFQRSLKAILNSFHSFSFILLFINYFHHSIFQLTHPFILFS